MNLLIRTDASVAIGTGHATRCLALAQAWQDAGGHAAFAMAESTPAVEARLRAESCRVISVACRPGSSDDAGQTVALAAEQGSTWIVIDGYQFGAEYQQVLKREGAQVLFLDDYGHARHYSADIVLNQNVSAEESLYASRDQNTTLLLGPEFGLLRREFNAWRDWQREVPAMPHTLLVMMGGSDPENLTARVIEALALVETEPLKTTVVIGGSNPHAGSLEKSVGSLRHNVALLKDVSNVADLMAQADIAVSAAGSTCWELCLLGLPALLLDVAANQTEVARELDRRRCAVHIGDQRTTVEAIAHGLARVFKDHALRVELSRNARQLVDGRGAERVVAVLQRGAPATADVGDGNVLRLRRARSDDAHLLWEWANDPEVRAASFSSEPVPWETHLAWLAGKLREPGSLIMIAQNRRGTPCGQIRFDQRSDGGWEVDVSVAKAVRGRGLASRLIGLGLDEMQMQHPGAIIHALVKPENLGSVKAFEKAGFMSSGAVLAHGTTAIHFVFGTRSA